MAPTANHRLLFRKREKEYLVTISNRLAIAGIATLAISMCSVILLISDVIFHAPTPLIAAAGAASYSARSGSCSR